MIIKLLLGSIILSVATYKDFKTRRVSNNLWILFGFISLLFFLFDGLDVVKLVFVFIFLTMFYIMFQCRLFGGADAKALMCITILVPLSVFSIFFISLLFTMLFIPFIFLYYKKSKTIKDIMWGYPFPFMLSLLCGFVFVIISGFDILSLGVMI